MTSLFEQVVPVPPQSKNSIEKYARDFLLEAAPEHLQRPGRLDLAHLIDNVLPFKENEIHVIPVDPDDPTDKLYLNNVEAMTEIPLDGSATNILMREDQYDALYGGDDSLLNRARSTCAHELSHALLHVPFYQTLNMSHQQLCLARKPRGQIQAFRDPEWQAWMLAGSLLAPRETIVQIRDMDLFSMSQVYGMSPIFLYKHLKRLGLNPYEQQRG